jgi:hypothetical protein
VTEVVVAPVLVVSVLVLWRRLHAVAAWTFSSKA